ncbi:hypothetical protein [Cellulomonas carbonis]|nr:hypothetical protein [Cellulomonas carbonis]GGC16755.1 hypothetical protein GCM10010972_32610 [Cellulomonas carbonis]
MTARSTRTITVLAVTAVVSLGAGLGLGRLVVSPAEAAANAAPPEAGPITVPVERRMLSNDVVLRGDVLYEDPTEVRLETGDLGGPAVVTGQVPEVGAEIAAGAVVLEITGRPVIALTGELPVYRTLRAGVAGPDVVQLKAALAELGISAGDPASDVYDSGTAAAVAELYARVGYPAPGTDDETEAALSAATEGVRGAEEQLAAARRDLAQASAGAPSSERAQRQADLDSARFELQQAESCVPGEARECDPADVVRARGAVTVAEAALAEVSAAPDTSAQRAGVDAARRALDAAEADLAEARLAGLTPLPAGEVVYLPTTPRRVDTVDVQRGSVLAGGAAMRVSGARLQIAGTVSAADAELLEVGSPAVIAAPDGSEVTGTVEEVGGGEDDAAGEGEGDQPGAGRTRVVVVPTQITEEQRAMLQGSNVRITIPVTSTTEAVLAVPLAALDTGPGGEARVDVLDDDGASSLVTVRTGLAADGFVEVTAVDGELAEGDRVVVGTSGEAADDDATGADEGGEDGG